MSVLDRLAGILPSFLTAKHDGEAPISLNRATYVELFFDLVFIFCIHNILPLLTESENSNVDWYSYYTFWFTFALMLQIWFNSTIFMNRFGTGRLPDIIFLLTNMFLLFVMTQAISTDWELYLIYNVSWILITINTIVHWLLRYRQIANPSEQITRDMRLSVITLGAQALLVLFSHALPKNPAQVVCLIAMLTGFLFWYAGGKNQLNEENRRHLVERCALLIVLTFGETLVWFGSGIHAEQELFTPIMYFLLIVGMFLIYLNEITNVLDLGALGGGRIYMAITAWLTFCVANVTAGFEMTVDPTIIMGIAGDVFLGLSIAVFMLSFFLLTPFNKYRFTSKRWVVARVVACVLVLSLTSAVAVATQQLLTSTVLSQEGFTDISATLGHVMMLIAVLAIYTVLTIDRIAVRRAAKAAKAAVEQDEPQLFDEYPSLHDELITLRRMTLDDEKALQELMESESAYRYAPAILYERAYPDARSVLENMHTECFLTRESLLLGVYLNERPQELVGIAEVYNNETLKNKASIGWRLAESAQGADMARRVVALLKEYLVSELGMRVITSHIMIENADAIAALKANGFFVEDADFHVLEDWGFAERTLVDKYVLIAFGLQEANSR